MGFKNFCSREDKKEESVSDFDKLFGEIESETYDIEKEDTLQEVKVGGTKNPPKKEKKEEPKKEKPKTKEKNPSKPKEKRKKRI